MALNSDGWYMVDSLAILVLLLSFERVTSRMDLSDSNGWATYILAWFEGLSRISVRGKGLHMIPRYSVFFIAFFGTIK